MTEFNETPEIDPQNKYVSIVEQTVQDHLVSSPASQAGAEVWSTIQKFITDLKQRVQEA